MFELANWVQRQCAGERVRLLRLLDTWGKTKLGIARLEINPLPHINGLTRWPQLLPLDAKRIASGFRPERFYTSTKIARRFEIEGYWIASQTLAAVPPHPAAPLRGHPPAEGSRNAPSGAGKPGGPA